ncbi:heavy metal translocating P-type ATPase [Gilvimarinus sp. DA14]|uniref:heavy metal translocating P-type ATPase n=1 Tax=Gilvimarinus sp. DA14 TaxID=2956798 RepID=UPI0020B86863|nr:heavy metal translocating P-type ATPase [Gilvimarinus sp. DA14]UTF60049.1 heavy metal translocating P-type ATPase [Gilvimarinus sp. DA14]
MSEQTAADCGCYHCGLPLPRQQQYPVEIDGQTRFMCCPGCQAVASAIVSGGLEQFYQYRSELSEKPGAAGQDFSVYDLPELQEEFVLPLGQNRHQANLLLEGISCAACSWLIEKHLEPLTGLESVRVNVTSYRAQLVYDPAQIKLSELMSTLAAIGYQPRPATDEQQAQLDARENRRALLRLGVAGFGMMQAGMVAVGLYTGAVDEWQNLLRWLSLLLATPVVFYSAWPFFNNAWRSLRSGALVMDVPVALAIGLGYGASVWATLSGSGDVYFESIAMFVFFLLLGRYLELRSRTRSRIGLANVAQLLPPVAERLNDGIWQQVPMRLLQLGDRVRVSAGQSFCADGVVLAGSSCADESLLTGESRPVAKTVGDFVIAGSGNIDSPVEIEVMAMGADTRLSSIERLIDRAQKDKPRRALIADRVARYFVAAVLLVCAGVYCYWHFTEPTRALWVALSVLVVTCPCALALAMPTALTTAAEYLRRQGVLMTRGHVLESLEQIDRVIFDKTGTLTSGHLSVSEYIPLQGKENREAHLAIAAALEEGSSHPIASAFAPWRGQFKAEGIKQNTGQGVSGLVNGERYQLGRPDAIDSHLAAPPGDCLWLLLADTRGPLAWVGLADPLRPEAAEVVARLQQQGIAVELLSGDAEANVARVARTLGITDYRAGASPDDKLSHLAKRQRLGDKVLMVGDGINDVPVLSAADVSLAMARASDLAQTHADALLLADSLQPLPLALHRARRTGTIVRQNLGLSLLYNLLALPLAAAGMVAPWAAALGMTTSSLLVVANALRLSR